MIPSHRRTSRRAVLASCVLLTGATGCIGDDDPPADDDPADDDRETDRTDEPEDDADDADRDDEDISADADEENDTEDQDDHQLEHPDSWDVDILSESVSHPWGMALLPGEESMLLTEREGRLSILDIENGEVDEIAGVPDVYAVRQGGLLDVELHPEYPEEAWVYLTYSIENDDGDSATTLGRGWLDLEELRLTDFEELHVVEPFQQPANHYGSRVVFGEDGMVYITSGDRNSKSFGPNHVSQRTDNEIGTTLRLRPDGSIPSDNPFVDDDDVLDSIFTYGHRNAQGMTVHPESGEVWQSEHGEEDGDEINIIEAGGNYGWPIATYSCEYGTEDPIGDEPHERADVVEPVFYWECTSGGFPPAGMTFYDGDVFPDWDGDLLLGGLAAQYLARFEVDGREVLEADPLLAEHEWRIRDVAVGADTGYIYVCVDSGEGPIARIVPE